MKPRHIIEAEEIGKVDDVLLHAILSAFMPPARLSSADWAEAHLVLPAESNAQPGKVRLTTYQRQILDACDDPKIRMVVTKLAAQTGKSLVADIVLLSRIDQDPGPTLLVHPTSAKAVGYIRDRFEPMAKATPVIKALIGKGRSQGSDTQSHKSYPGGSLNVASSHVAEDLAARAIKLAILDEVDRFAISAGREGDPVTLSLKRQRSFANALAYLSSTPTQAGASRIDEKYNLGTCEQFAIPCPSCGSFQVPKIANLHWPKGQPGKAHLTCEECAHPITERERLKAVKLGTFIATNPDADPTIRSFHASELISEFSSLASVAQQSEDAITPEQRKVFTNTVLAEVYDINAETFADPETLQARAVEMVTPYSADISFVTIGADVQKDRIEVMFVGHGESNEKWILDRIVIGGDTSSDQPWMVLSATIKNALFRLKDGRTIPPSATFVDAGYMTTGVYNFAKVHQRVWPIFGRNGWDRPAIIKGRRVLGPLHSVIVGVDNVKMSVAKMLANATPGANYIHLPAHLDQGFFDQLTAERLETKYSKGFAKNAWTKHPMARNEAFDLLVYATAAAAIVTKPMKPVSSKPAKTISEIAADLNAASNQPGTSQRSNVYPLLQRKA